VGIERLGLAVAVLVSAGCTGKDAPVKEQAVAPAPARAFETATFSLG